MMRLADVDLLPFEFGDFADTVQTYLKELKTLSQKMQDDIKERNKEIEGLFKASDDPKHPLVAPPVEAGPATLEFRSLRERRGLTHAQRGGIPQGTRSGECQWRRSTRFRFACRDQQDAHGHGAQTHQCRGPSQSSVV